MTEGLSPREKRTIAEQAELLRGLRDRLSKVERAQDLRRSTIRQGEGPKIVDADGNVVGEIGGQDGLYGHSDRTKPPTPAAPLVEGGVGFLRVTIVEGSEPRDAKLYAIHASTEQGYQVSPGTMVGSILPGDSTVTINLPGGIYHVRAQWVSLAGVHSDASEPVTVEVSPQVDEERIQEVLDEAQGLIDAMRTWADGKFAEMDGREQEFRDAINAAQTQLDAAQGILDQLPAPADLTTAVQQAQDAINTLGNVSQRLTDAETAIQTNATQTSQNLTALDGKLNTARAELEGEIADAAGTAYWDRIVARQGFVTPEAIVERMLADGILANILEVAHATVAARNILPNGDLSQGTTFWDSRMTLESDSPPGFSNSLSYSAGNIRANEQRFPLEGGQEYLFEMWVKADKPGSSLVVELRNDSGGAHASASNVSLDGNNTNATTDNLSVYLAWHSPTTTWQKIRTVVKVNSGVAKAYLGVFYFNHTSGSVRDAKVSIAGLRLTSRVDGSMVVENSITADKVHATTEMITKILGADIGVVNQMIVNGNLFANHVTALNAALQNLSVTEKANFVDAFADQLYATNFAARVAAIGRLIVAAPNILPGVTDARASDFWSPFGRNTSNNTVWVQGSNVQVSSTGSIPLEADTEYRFTTSAFASTAGTRYTVQIVNRVEGATGSPVVLSNELAGPNYAGRIKATGVFKVNHTGNYGLRITGNTSAGAANTGYQWFESPRIERMTDGQLIVPGTIETEHLNVTQSMVGRFAQFLEVAAGMIRSDAFEGGTYTGGTFDGSVVRGGRFETHEAVDRGVKITPDGRLIVYDTVGNVILNLGAGQFSSFNGRIRASNGANLPTIVLKPSGESQTGEGSTMNAGVFFIRDGSSGIPGLSVVAGVYIRNPANTGAESLRLRGQNGGSVVIDTDVNFDARGSQTDLGHTIITPDTTNQGLTVRSSAGNNRLVINNGFSDFYNNVSVPDNFSIRNRRTTNATANTHIDANGIFYATTSASRYKVDQQTHEVPDALLDLEVKTWVDKNTLDRKAAAEAKRDSGEELDWIDEADLNPDLTRVAGVIAEDVEALDPTFALYDSEGRIESVAYDRLAMAAFPLIRRQRDRINELEGTVQSLEARLAALEERL